MYSPDLHNELRDRINISDERPFGGLGDSPRGRPPSEDRQGNGYPGGRHPSDDNSSRGRPASPMVSPRSPRQITLSQYSTAAETREWLESKGFTKRLIILILFRHYPTKKLEILKINRL